MSRLLRISTERVLKTIRVIQVDILKSPGRHSQKSAPQVILYGTFSSEPHFEHFYSGNAC